VYDLGTTLAIVATDRISAFDYTLHPGIPNKGRVLTKMSLFWFEWLKVPNHLISADLADLPPEFHRPELDGRTMLVRKTTVVPVECVARGYLLGSGWKEYRADGTVCGIKLEPGLELASQLPHPIFTPATKAETGHDENISFEQMAAAVGAETAAELRERTLDVYATRACAGDHSRGHETGMGPTAVGRTDSHRRGADAGQLAVLAGGVVPCGRVAAVVRQAVRPRLARNDRVGQGRPAAGTAGRGGAAHGRKVSGGARPTGRLRALRPVRSAIAF
jgi:hypothetical protein